MAMSRGTLSVFWAAMFGTITGLLAWNVGAWAWRRFGWIPIVALVAIYVLLNVYHLVKYWIDGRAGLDQWPEPHGRYYSEWLSLPSEAADYYEWLASKMGNREPWRTWARKDRAHRESNRVSFNDADDI